MILQCPQKGCNAEVQATVPCWLTLGPDGEWEISGFGYEAAEFYCAEDHHIKPDELLPSVSAFLEPRRAAT
jgi:hypothetical protein